MRKKLFALVIALTLVSSITQAWTVPYPSKRTLKKADHITSLIVPAAFASAYIANNYDSAILSDGLLAMHAGVLVANTIINGMALKHERSIAAILKFLLPVSISSGWIVFLNGEEDSGQETAGRYIATAGLYINGIKNIWDIYSLGKQDQSESTPYDA